MARKKVVLAFIEKDAVRWATFKKRRRGLIKKINELITLVGTKGCCLIYYPNEAEPTIWPSTEEAREYLLHFRGLPEMEKTKNMLDQDMFLNNMILKLHKKVEKLKEEVYKLELTVLLVDISDGRRSLEDVGLEDVLDLRILIREKMKELDEASKKVTEDEQKRQAEERTTMEEDEKERQAAAWIMEMANQNSWFVETSGGSSSMVQPSVGGSGESIVDENIVNNDL